MEIKVLGPGCSKCNKLFEETRKAIDETGVDATLEKIERIDEIADHGVMFTPALVIDGEVKSSGKVLTAAKIAALLLGLFLFACGGEPTGASGEPVAPTDEAASSSPEPAGEAAMVVAKIVFLDQKECCDCTRARIDGTWAELQVALGTDAPLPVERIHMDTQPTAAEPFLALRPTMVPPGLYFLDADGALVEMLQGELTEAQIASMIP